MDVSKISIFNTNIPKTKKQKITEGGIILGGSTALGLGVYGIIDNYTEKRDYIKLLKAEKADFYTKAMCGFKADIEKIKEQYGFVAPQTKAYVWKYHKNAGLPYYNNQIALLDKLRKSILKKHLAIAGGIGLGVGAVAVGVKTILENKQLKTSGNFINKFAGADTGNSKISKKSSTEKTPETSDKTKPAPTSFKGNNIAFTGIIDKLADELTPEKINELQQKIDGKDATNEELEYARKIGSLRIDKDWPKGLNNINRLLYGFDTWKPILKKPKTDREYQMILLKQDIKVPYTPPKYYRLYDRLFNTERWQDYKKWPEYIDACLKYERAENLITRARLESYAKERAAAELAAKKELTAACIKYRINQDFLLDFNSDNKKAKIPNAIMIESRNNKDSEETIKWLVAKSKSNYTHIEDKGDSNEIRRDQILTMIEKAQEDYEKNEKRTLLWVENFDKLLSNSPENEDVVADFKDLLEKLSKDYKTTIVFNCSNTETLNPITVQPHRVKKYNIDREATTEELQKLHDNLILSSIEKIKNTDGYRYKYILFDNTQHVDLYLGDFGYTPNVLWVDSQNTDAINAVIQNFNVIKNIPYFAKVKSLKFPKPNNMQDLNIQNMRCTGDITADGKVIYEYSL